MKKLFLSISLLISAHCFGQEYKIYSSKDNPKAGRLSIQVVYPDDWVARDNLDGIISAFFPKKRESHSVSELMMLNMEEMDMESAQMLKNNGAEFFIKFLSSLDYKRKIKEKVGADVENIIVSKHMMFPAVLADYHSIEYRAGARYLIAGRIMQVFVSGKRLSFICLVTGHINNKETIIKHYNNIKPICENSMYSLTILDAYKY